MKLIESKTLVTAQASIEFTSIPQTYTDLRFVLSLRSSRAAPVENAYLQFNNSSTSYTYRRLYGTGSGTFSGTETKIYFDPPAGSSTSNTFGNTSIYIPNYAGSTNKSVSIDDVTENNATLSYQLLSAGLWSNTSAITSVKFLSDTGSNFTADSVVSLYGILKGSDGIVTTS